MRSHADVFHNEQPSPIRLIFVVFLITLFGISAIFSFEYFGGPISGVQKNLQSASVAEALEARKYFSHTELLAQSAIVVDLSSAAVLFDLNPDAQLPLASLTKVALVVAAADVLDPSSLVTIPRDTTYNSKADQLVKGERIRVRDLIRYTLVSSSNDGAEMLAEATNEPLQTKYGYTSSNATLVRMNALAADLGMTSTYFLNTTGLDQSMTQSGAYGSTRDIAKLFAYTYAHYADLFSDTATSSLEITLESGKVVKVTNTDEALESLQNLKMGKTGLTDLAGGNLAIIFEANGRTLVAVVLGSTEKGRFSDILQLAKSSQNLPRSQ